MRRVPGVLALGLAATTPAQAQVRQEWSALAVAATGRPASVTAGAGLARRVGRRDRVQLFLGAGAAADRPVVRVEALWHLLLEPDRVRGAGLYLGGGVAGEAGRASRARLVVTLGLETAPAGRSGWVVEAGIGGGARVAVGWKRRT